MKNRYLIIALCIALQSCKNNTAQQGYSADLIKSVNEYSENEFPIAIEGIVILNDRIIMADEGLGKIIVSDLDLSNFQVFGEPGYGPNELLKPSMIIPYEDNSSVLIYDKGHLKFFSQDPITNQITQKSKFGYLLMNQKIVLEDSIISFTSPLAPNIDILKFDLQRETPIDSISLKNSSPSFFGRYLFKKGNNYISIKSYNTLVIELFDENWVLLSKTDLSNQKYIQDILKPKKESSVSVSGSAKVSAKATGTVSDAVYYKDQLYLLVYSLDKEGKSKANRILVFDYKESEWKEQGSFELLPNGSYQSFAITKNGKGIIAFNRIEGSIEMFKINK
ncbi:hypothetical protein ACV07N_05085 [Roseivirga echinicomitans]